MSKFKVGESVRVCDGGAHYSNFNAWMKTNSLRYFDEWKNGSFYGGYVELPKDTSGTVVVVAEHPFKRVTLYLVRSVAGSLFLIGERGLVSEQIQREFIVIRRDDREVIASHKRGDEIVKTAKATCAPSDEFNFETGVKLAFDRLMGREADKVMPRCKIPESAPQPAHRFKVGDRVLHKVYGLGTILEVFSEETDVPYFVKPDNADCGITCWAESRVSPAPEPKHYTGKVFAVKTIYQGLPYEILSRNGRVFEIKNGMILGELDRFGMTNNRSPFKSFGDFCSAWFSTEWQEVKE